MSTRLAEASTGASTEAPVDDVSVIDSPTEVVAAPPIETRHHRRSPLAAGRLPSALRAGTPAWTWLGVALAGLGFVLLAVGWGQVAGETQLYLQMPYVVSAAMAGLGVIMVGLVILDVAARQQDAQARDRQMEQLLAAIDELQEIVAQPKPGPKRRAR
jgi:hypothetical protein